VGLGDHVNPTGKPQTPTITSFPSPKPPSGFGAAITAFLLRRESQPGRQSRDTRPAGQAVARGAVLYLPVDGPIAAGETVLDLGSGYARSA